MKGEKLYEQVRRAVHVEGLSRREAARRFGIDPGTVAKMLTFSVPPGYRRSKPPVQPKLDRFVAIIDRILEEDRPKPAKQQHTSKRIFERLRDEHGYSGGITIVRDYVHERRLRPREMTLKEIVQAGLLSEISFQQYLESRRLELRRGNLYHFLDVLNMAANHAARSKDDCCRLPQWFLERLSNLLELVFLAPLPPGGFGRVRKQLRQHLLDLVRFQAVVNSRCEGRSVDEAYDLAAQALQRQGYEGGDEAVRRSYKRILNKIRDVGDIMSESGKADQKKPRMPEEDPKRRQVIISDATSGAIRAISRRAKLDKLGSPKPRPEIEVPPFARLSVAEALLLSDKALPGTEYIKRRHQ